ncbi:MAG: RNA methyltransferase [Angelakisella sp.]
MEQLSSKDNSTIKLCRSLAADPGARSASGLAFVEGVRLCRDAAATVPIQTLLVTEQAYRRWQPELTALSQMSQSTYLITPALADSIAQTQNSQGCYCICQTPHMALPTVKNGSFLLLERLQDPGNLGTIIRCAEAFGMDAVLCSPDCADLWSPKVLRSAMGSCFRQCVVVSQDLCATARQLTQSGVSVYAATLTRDAVLPQQMTRGSGGIAVAIGNEGAGLTTSLLDCCTSSVFIPMTDRIESLNAATAATVLMWELCGRGGKGGQTNG